MPQPQPSPSPGKDPENLKKSIQSVVESGAVGAPTGASPKDPPVFMGWVANPVKSVGSMFLKPQGPYAPGYTPGGLGSFATSGGGSRPDTQSVSQVTGQFYSWDQKTRDKFLSQVALAGYDTNNMKDAQLAALWGNYVAQAANYYAQGVTVTPWDIIAKDRDQREAYMNTPRTVKQTSKSFDMSTEGDARAIFYTAAQQLLGRDPTKAEVTSFQKALNDMERANPTVTTTTANYLGDTLQSQESETTGGVKEGARQMMSMDKAKSSEEYGAYQAATTYFDAMMQMLGGME